MERRILVGRRYEDYLKNDIFIVLTGEELLWQIIYSDPRYNPIIERRKNVRRKSDAPLTKPFTFLQSETGLALTEEPLE